MRDAIDEMSREMSAKEHWWFAFFAAFPLTLLFCFFFDPAAFFTPIELIPNFLNAFLITTGIQMIAALWEEFESPGIRQARAERIQIYLRTENWS